MTLFLATMAPLAIIMTGGLMIYFWPRYLNLRRPVEALECSLRGHVWHEGDDTLITIEGHRDGPYHHGGFTWLCLRCHATTDVGEAPPKNKYWDKAWVNPGLDPWGREKDCANVYRMEQWDAEERRRKNRAN